MRKLMFADTAGGVSLHGTVELGTLIGTLQRHRVTEHGDDERLVIFDFGAMVPMKLTSYRGYYDHLALGFGDARAPKVGELLLELESACGKRFHGYKGGEYVMGLQTPVWAANHDRSTNTAIIGLAIESSIVALLTEYVE